MVPAAGVPERLPDPFPLSTNVTPLGNAPVSVIEGVGVPTVLIVKLPGLPRVNVVLVPDVMDTPSSTVRVKD